MTLRILLLAMMCLPACSSASRAHARGAVLAGAEAIKVGDKACATAALEKTDLELARTCEAAYVTARSAIVAAAESVDAWDEGKKGDVACALKRAAAAIATTTQALRSRSVAVPKVVEDALALADKIGACS